MAFTLFTIYEVNAFLEIHDSVNRVPVVDLISSIIENEKFIKHLKDVRGRLMDDCEHQLSLKTELFQQIDDIFRVARRQTACRLVAKQDGRLPKQLEAYVQSLALPPTDSLPQR